ncbi:DNA polymerase ligase N-terminal domain-containing protein [Actinotalea sp. Marseille-Q4924]|uniref:non-homologous end-joining DNA ligase LigD n=1 Tax=Actinotalea sp. Marseille-Q4924 TaxID=2866571 RepID=UPI001CE3ECE7|nr:DNA polymerase ligase N-terminal domain-containing protein [Actinotalea sp. Marseille-Q4924]
MDARRRRSRAAPTGGLDTYRSMRDFERTPEPAGAATERPSEGALRFVVQRHRARRLHYDLRFEMAGVLASWAVPRGPTLDPTVKRMAVHVEDHPLEYAAFEGVIPAREYGGGDVIVWDHGTWEPHGTDDPVAAVAAGELHAEVHGERLRGRLVLVRRGDPEPGGKEQWLLLHKRDEHAVVGWDAEDHPTSVVSGRTNEEVLRDPERLWRSDLPAAEASVELRPPVPPSPAAPPGPSEDELAALDAMGAAGTWEVLGRSLRVTNLDKVLFPGRDGAPPVTKRELVRYAAQIAPVVLPYLRGRALNMHRYPNGADRPGFWHKELPDHAPGWLPRWDNPEADEGETTTYLVVDEPAALVWAANFGALEWHAWTSPTTEPHRPTYAFVDLDPGTTTGWEDLLVLARLHRDAFAHLGVRAYPKLTGRRGIQVWVPIAPGPGFDETRAWVERVSKTVGAVVADLVSWRWEVRERGGLARLDYTQNAINKTLVAPYSPRPPGAPVSAPITWDELDEPWLRPDAFTVRTVLERLAERGDPFRGVLAADQTLPRLA